MANAAERAAKMAAALVTEINAERGRQGLMSSRELGRRIGKSSQYVSDRLDGGSPKTGRRTILTVWDLSAMSQALGVPEADLIERAERALKLVRMQQDLTLVTGRLVGEDEAATELDRIEREKAADQPTSITADNVKQLRPPRAARPASKPPLKRVARKRSTDRGGDDGQG